MSSLQDVRKHIFHTIFLAALSPAFMELETIINLSSVVSAECEPRTCKVSPLPGTSVQDYRSEVSFLKEHLNGLGVTLKEEPDGLSR